MTSNTAYNETDRRARPYHVSLDWLSLSCRTTPFSFLDREVQPTGYVLEHLMHGSKFFRHIAAVYDPEGTLVGELSWEPCNPAIHKESCIFKADNSLLYEREGVERFWCAVLGLQLEYRGINRIDLACDQNEFFNGLKPQNLLDRYFARKYLKLGVNHGIDFFDLKYHGVQNREGGLTAWTKIPLVTKKQRENYLKHIEERNADIGDSGIPHLKADFAHQCESLDPLTHNSVTWGLRGNPVQVQLYNKTKELQEVKMKHHIVNAWKEAGLNLCEDVYRVEIRIQGRGKGLVNPATGKEFNLNLQDVVLQEQIEELFFAYASKYFAFYHEQGKDRVSRNKPLQLWHRRPASLLPRQTKPKRNPSRFTLVLVNAIKREEACTPITPEYESTRKALRAVGSYLESAYELQAWAEDKELSEKYQSGYSLVPESPEHRNTRAWTIGKVAQHVIERAAEWKRKTMKENPYFALASYKQRERWADMEVNHDEVFTPPANPAPPVPLEKLIENTERCHRYLVFNALIPPEPDYPFPAPAEDKFVDWDAMSNS